MNVQTVPVRGQSANTRSGRYHLGGAVGSANEPKCPTHRKSTKPAAPRMGVNNRSYHTTCLVLLQAMFRSRPFNRALRRSRTARFVEVNMGINPRNVRSEGVAPCKV
jgi:hypothetical protein